ncbi:larval cuticle protein A2B-like [Cylas formicarius]|uniref:larval cuticle protein A2B-like n=1 Tax=Cylas formicarius TaxID=197179 RepID=UPI002958BBD5|nr:larval cuticle protein A2B-like [Cylas formicarius]
MFKIVLICAVMATTTKAAPISILDHEPIGVAAHYALSHAPLAIAHAPVAIAHAPLAVKAEPYDAHPRYEFKYGVKDPHTGDYKEQEETRDGDVVKGSYALIEPDGSKRRVDYTADSVHGFNAVVSKEPLHHVEHVAHAPLTIAHAPVTVAHAPLPIEHAPYAIEHAPLALEHAHVALPAALSHSTAIYHH